MDKSNVLPFDNFQLGSEISAVIRRFLIALNLLVPTNEAALAQGLPPCPPVAREAWTGCRGAFANRAGDYNGEFEYGKVNGFGTFRNRNGNVYTGHWKDAKFEGQGTLTYADGHIFSGQWKENKREGKGKASAPDGEIIEGYWHDNRYIGPYLEGGSNQTNQEFPVSRPPNSEKTPTNQIEVGLQKENGTYKVPVLINGVLTLNFTVDSGAADVSIPADVVLVMMRTGTLVDGDFLGTQMFVLANGTKVPSKIFRIRTLKIGSKTIENVIGNMSNIEGSLLLGQSFLSRFASVSFDYNRQILVLR